MRRVKFYFSSGTVHGKCEEIVEYEDDVSDKDIDEDFECWLYERSNATWWDIDEKN